MWDRIRDYINSLRNEDSIEECVDLLIEYLQDSGLGEDDQYEIETSLYGLMDNHRTVKSFLKKAATMIRKKVLQFNKEMFYEGLMFYEEEMADALDENDPWDTI